MHPLRCRSILAAFGLVLLLAACLHAATRVTGVPAFPGAEGFGSHTPGGRGGRVIEVTNLNADGPGSFREAVKATGPRIIVFRVSGLIDLERGLTIREPFVTIAGQTAPGDGICLYNSGLTISTHNVVVRHLRMRPGDGPGGRNPGNRDCLSIEGPGDRVHDIVIDHCSFSWATDENVTTWNSARDVTIQWSITSESLRDSISPSGAHSFALLLGSGNNTVSVHHCLLAHDWQRNPFLSGDPKAGATASIIDFRNNLIYNRRQWPDARLRDAVWFNYVGNTVLVAEREGTKPGYSSIPFGLNGRPENQRYHLADNLWPGQGSDSHGNVGEPIAAPPVTTLPRAEAIEQVLRFAGATQPVRDVVDARVIEEVRTGTGDIVNSPAEVGGWPDYRSAPAPADADHDGMPDAWERLHGFDPNDALDGSADADGDVYTNIEEYLNHTDPNEKTSGTLLAQQDPAVQAGNDALRFGTARQSLPQPQYEPAQRESFVNAVRASGRDVADYVGIRLVSIAPGEFEMHGPEGVKTTVHVTLTRPYDMAVTEITQEQWLRVMRTKPWLNRDYAKDASDQPATYVSHHDAREFVARLNAAGNDRYRLPTDAEWEWAWLAGQPRPTEQDHRDIAWHSANTVDRGQLHPSGVGRMEPNARGLHDLAGNVHEWCHDLWAHWYWRRGGERTDPMGGVPGEDSPDGYHVVRGGSFYHTPLQLSRFPASYHRPEYRSFEVGFRVVREVEGAR